MPHIIPPEKWIPKSASGRYLQLAKSSGPLAVVASSGPLADFGIHFSGGTHQGGIINFVMSFGIFHTLCTLIVCSSTLEAPRTGDVYIFGPKSIHNRKFFIN